MANYRIKNDRPQWELVYDYLTEYGSITSSEAELRLGIVNVSNAIRKAKKLYGIKVAKEKKILSTNPFAFKKEETRYRLIESSVNA